MIRETMNTYAANAVRYSGISGNLVYMRLKNIRIVKNLKGNLMKMVKLLDFGELADCGVKQSRVETSNR